MEKTEIITQECAKVAVYERLAKEGQVNGDEGGEKKNSALALLGKVLRLKKARFHNISNGNGNGNDDDDKMKKVEEKKEEDDDAQQKKTKKRCSWLPDPERRWPVQGWS